MSAFADFLRLLALPVLAYAARKDHNRRRVPSGIWWPLILLGIVVTALEVAAVYPVPMFDDLVTIQKLAVTPALTSVAVVILHHFGALESGDAKALFTLSLVFQLPSHVTFHLVVATVTLPVFSSGTEPFFFTIIKNTFVLGILYPITMWIQNARNGRFTVKDLRVKPVAVNQLQSEAGYLYGQTPDSDIRLDLDTLRMYLRWRNTDLEKLVDNGTTLRDPQTIMATHETTDGARATTADGGERPGNIDTEETPAAAPGIKEIGHGDRSDGDPWGAEAFFEDAERDYGDNPERLRRALDEITTADEVWIEPGVPFLVPLLGGVILSLTVGDWLLYLR